MHAQLVSRLALSLAAVACLLVATTAFAEEKPTPIAPEAARDHEGKLVVVEFEVKASKNAKRDDKPLAFLDSEYDFHDEKNIGVAVHAEALEQLKAKGIEFATTHFMKKRIRVTGKIEIRDDRPYLDVREASQIEVVTPPATEAPKAPAATPEAAPTSPPAKS